MILNGFGFLSAFIVTLIVGIMIRDNTIRARAIGRDIMAGLPQPGGGRDRRVHQDDG